MASGVFWVLFGKSRDPQVKAVPLPAATQRCPGSYRWLKVVKGILTFNHLVPPCKAGH